MLFYYFMIKLFHFYFHHLFDFFTLFLVLFFGLSCFWFHTFFEYPIPFCSFSFQLVINPAVTFFLEPAWEDICPKLISINFEALQTCYQLSCISHNFPVLIFLDSEQIYFFNKGYIFKFLPVFWSDVFKFVFHVCFCLKTKKYRIMIRYTSFFNF